MKAQFLSENDLMRRDSDTGHFYFSENTMRSFKGLLHSGGYPIQTNKGLIYLFVDSTKFKSNPRNYQVTMMVENGDTSSQHIEGFENPSQANRFLTEMLPPRDRVHPSWLVWFAFDLLAYLNIRTASESDLVWILNLVAMNTGTGDGRGGFTFNHPDESEFESLADNLVYTYSYHIYKSGKTEARARAHFLSRLQMSVMD